VSRGRELWLLAFAVAAAIAALSAAFDLAAWWTA
jgi:hypothetical protein